MDPNDEMTQPDVIEIESAPLSHKILVVVVGLGVGSLMCFSNMYFGLQTGFISMMSLQSALLGYGAFQLLKSTFPDKFPNPFTIHDNVLLQTIGVATATMPLAAGFVGIIPAIQIVSQEMDTDSDETIVLSQWWEQIIWSLSVAFVGVFVAVPLRKQVILREKLKFPSGTATAKMLQVIHRVKEDEGEEEGWEKKDFGLEQEGEGLVIQEEGGMVGGVAEEIEEEDWSAKWRMLFICFGISSFYTLLAYFFPFMSHLPVFSWVGLPMVTAWQWTLTPSFSYAGQGMIMGMRSALSMFAGSVFGWGIVGPMAQSFGWCNPVMDWQTGCSGWIMWMSLAIMMGEALVSLSLLVGQTVYRSYKEHQERGGECQHLFRSEDEGEREDSDIDPAPISQRVPIQMWGTGLAAACALCIAVDIPLFGMKWYEPVIALIFSLLTAILAVRALGETDLNPVSGIGKISQIIFGFVAPGNLIANLIAGGIAEASAQQAGDLMQDLKCGHLLRASPRAQFFGQLLGSFFSIFVSVGAYALYTSAFTIPSEEFPVPTAFIWIDMAELVNGGSLADNVLWFCVGGAIVAGMLALVAFLRPTWKEWMPSAVAFAIGMYITPNWSVARMVGALVQYVWEKKDKKSHDKYMIIVASGFVLGEGITSIFTAILASAHVPSYPFHPIPSPSPSPSPVVALENLVENFPTWGF